MSTVERLNVCHIWTKDYITGISALVGWLDNDIRRLEKEIKFYQWFIDDWSKNLLHGMGKVSQDPELVEHEALCDLLTDLRSSLDVENLKTHCLAPLKNLITKTKGLRLEMEQQLRSLHTNYFKDLKAMSESLNLYNRKASQFTSFQPKDSQKAPSNIALDDHLKFSDSSELHNFLARVKQSMPSQKKGLMNYLGVEVRNSFQGKVMLEAIKKNTEKVDTSPYNMEKLGQRLLDLSIIQQDSLAIGGRHIFTQEGYYHWAHMSNESTSDTSLTNWFKGLSMGNIDDVAIDELKERYFARCSKLEYSRFEMEKAISQKYEEYSQNVAQDIKKVFVHNREIFDKLFRHDKSTRPIDISLCQPLHYFTRDSSNKIVKWEPNHDQLVCREMMFGCQTIDTDTVDAVCSTLKHIMTFDDGKDLEARIVKSWTNGSVIDMNRAVNLKIDLITTFKEMNHATNLRAVGILMASNRYGVVDDWINFIKLWLLEIPGSLIPPKCCDLITKNQAAWIDEMPLNNLHLLIQLCKHLGQLDLPASQPQNPIYHYFIRPLDCLRSATNDYEVYEPWIISLFHQVSSLQQAYDERRRQGQTSEPLPPPTPSIQVRSVDDPTTPPLPSLTDETFVPRPFRTVSAASSTPGSPAPTRSSKRISGLVIELPAGSPTSDEQ